MLHQSILENKDVILFDKQIDFDFIDKLYQRTLLDRDV